jgi:hypothetical protein
MIQERQATAFNGWLMVVALPLTMLLSILTMALTVSEENAGTTSVLPLLLVAAFSMNGFSSSIQTWRFAPFRRLRWINKNTGLLRMNPFFH